MKIYTKKGDKGETGLLNGTRVKKSHLRIECVGQLDELNCNIGVVVAYSDAMGKRLDLQWLQDALFVIGGHIAVDPAKKLNFELPPWQGEIINRLESEIDSMEAELPVLNYFILPGGNNLTAQVHMARTVSRRVERCLVLLNSQQSINTDFIVFLNRLSDYFFVLSRYLSQKHGIKEVKWNQK